MTTSLQSLLLLVTIVSQLVAGVLSLDDCTINSNFSEMALNGGPIVVVVVKTKASFASVSSGGLLKISSSQWLSFAVNNTNPSPPTLHCTYPTNGTGEHTETRPVADLPGLQQLYGTSPAGANKMLARKGVAFQLVLTPHNEVWVWAKPKAVSAGTVLLCHAKFPGLAFKNATLLLTMAGRLRPNQRSGEAASKVTVERKPWFAVDHPYKLSTDIVTSTTGMRPFAIPRAAENLLITERLHNDNESKKLIVVQSYDMCKYYPDQE